MNDRPVTPRGFDPERDVMISSQHLRALSHPVRVHLLGLLRTEGPSTATALAGRLGLNSGATSYHLRQLAAAGLVDEDTERGNARDRWWRARHQKSWFDPGPRRSGEELEAGVAYLRAVATTYAEKMIAAVDELPSLPAAWSENAFTISDETPLLTPDEAAQLIDDIRDVIARYRRLDAENAPEDVRPVSVQYQVFPRTGGTA